MSKYVMSDLHGCYDKFIEMLNLIDFKESDELYILGDIFDRGTNPLGILDYVIGHKNIYLLKGNHESLFEDYFENGSAYLWYMNGGNTTHSQIMKKGYIQEELIYKYIKILPYIKVIDKFILVHAGVTFFKGYNDVDLETFIKYQEEESCLWDRSNINENLRYKDYTIICGHTPVQSITGQYEDVKILHKEGTIYIDCGCVFGGKLACLRLDDMKEFYV